MNHLLLCALLFCMAGVCTKAVGNNNTSPEENMEIFNKMILTIDHLAERPMYEGSYEKTLDESDGQNDEETGETTAVIGDGSKKGKRAKRYVNSFDQIAYFICPNRESISRISSYHSNRHEDRRYSFSCKQTFDNCPRCFQTGWVNGFDERVHYTCPRNYVMAGMVSYHSNRHEDRRFMYRCCTAAGFRTSNCYWTPYVNDFDAYFEWYSPPGRYLAGVYSYHDNGREDRRFRFYVCS